MSTIYIIDTFAEFENYWCQNKDKTIDQQLAAWEKEYMASWPELLKKQVKNYMRNEVDWRQIACEKVFPFLQSRLQAMQHAHQNLLNLCEPVYYKVQKTIGLEDDVIIVIYIGIGCGAGWATMFQNTPSILFGLENIAESGWSESDAITGLIAHELGHLVHNCWRAHYDKPIGSGSWWQIYEEGFAQRCESMVLGSSPWHQEKNDSNWLSWCKNQRNLLASEFIRMVDTGESTAPFFGSWLNIFGKSETGYYLGHEVIKKLEKQYNIKEIALLENVEEYIRPALSLMSQV